MGDSYPKPQLMDPFVVLHNLSEAEIHMSNGPACLGCIGDYTVSLYRDCMGVSLNGGTPKTPQNDQF